MTVKKKKLVIFGAGEFAYIAYEYFTFDSEYEVVAFVVEDNYFEKNTYLGLIVIPFSELEITFSKNDFEIFVALTATKMNRERERIFLLIKELGYQFANYISSRAFVWRDASIGENCFIFENNVIQPSVTIGNNCILWSGNHIGHRTIIGNNVFISSHVVLSGYCKVDDYCYFGVNSTVHNNVHIHADCIIGAGSMVNRDTISGLIYVGSPAKAVPGKTSLEIVF